MKIRICIAGATGWVGRSLVPAILQSGDLEIAGAVARSLRGQTLGSALNLPGAGIVICGSIEDALKTATDVLIDYTKPDIVKHNVLYAISKGVHAVVGTSGLTDEDYEDIDAAARAQKVGVIAAGNFAITAILLQKFAVIAAKHLPQWEIIEYNNPSKPDAPSGTTRELLYKLSQTKRPVIGYPVENTVGPKETRGATVNGTQVHSVRLAGFVSSTEIILGGDDERLRITQEAGNSAEPYVAGTLLAARKVVSAVGLVRGLEKFLEI